MSCPPKKTRCSRPCGCLTAFWRQTPPALRKVPEITLIFWVVKVLTTPMGEVTSDFLIYQINPVS
jgi:uncharacterized membrane-anchored protein